MQNRTLLCLAGVALLIGCDRSLTAPVYPGDSQRDFPVIPDGLDAIVGAPVSCVRGIAATFPCSNVDLVSFLPLADLGGGLGVPAYPGDPGSRPSDSVE